MAENVEEVATDLLEFLEAVPLEAAPVLPHTACTAVGVDASAGRIFVLDSDGRVHYSPSAEALSDEGVWNTLDADPADKMNVAGRVVLLHTSDAVAVFDAHSGARLGTENAEDGVCFLGAAVVGAVDSRDLALAVLKSDNTLLFRPMFGERRDKVVSLEDRDWSMLVSDPAAGCIAVLCSSGMQVLAGSMLETSCSVEYPAESLTVSAALCLGRGDGVAIACEDGSIWFGTDLFAKSPVWFQSPDPTFAAHGDDPAQWHLCSIPSWSKSGDDKDIESFDYLIMAAESHTTEISVFGIVTGSDNQRRVVQFYIKSEQGLPQLPLSQVDPGSDTFPQYLCVDYSSGGDCPLVTVLNSDNALCPFRVYNASTAHPLCIYNERHEDGEESALPQNSTDLDSATAVPVQEKVQPSVVDKKQGSFGFKVSDTKEQSTESKSFAFSAAFAAPTPVNSTPKSAAESMPKQPITSPSTTSAATFGAKGSLSTQLPAEEKPVAPLVIDEAAPHIARITEDFGLLQNAIIHEIASVYDAFEDLLAKTQTASILAYNQVSSAAGAMSSLDAEDQRLAKFDVLKVESKLAADKLNADAALSALLDKPPVTVRARMRSALDSLESAAQKLEIGDADVLEEAEAALKKWIAATELSEAKEPVGNFKQKYPSIEAIERMRQQTPASVVYDVAAELKKTAAKPTQSPSQTAKSAYIPVVLPTGEVMRKLVPGQLRPRKPGTEQHTIGKPVGEKTVLEAKTPDLKLSTDRPQSFSLPSDAKLKEQSAQPLQPPASSPLFSIPKPTEAQSKTVPGKSVSPTPVFALDADKKPTPVSESSAKSNSPFATLNQDTVLRGTTPKNDASTANQSTKQGGESKPTSFGIDLGGLDLKSVPQDKPAASSSTSKTVFGVLLNTEAKAAEVKSTPSTTSASGAASNATASPFGFQISGTPSSTPASAAQTESRSPFGFATSFGNSASKPASDPAPAAAQSGASDTSQVSSVFGKPATEAAKAPESAPSLSFGINSSAQAFSAGSDAKSPVSSGFNSQMSVDTAASQPSALPAAPAPPATFGQTFGAGNATAQPAFGSGAVASNAFGQPAAGALTEQTSATPAPANAAPVFGQSTFGQPSAAPGPVAAAPVFGQSSFGQAPAGGPSATGLAFGQTSTFGQRAMAPVSSTGGFAQQAQAAPAGQSLFGQIASQQGQSAPTEKKQLPPSFTQFRS